MLERADAPQAGRRREADARRPARRCEPAVALELVDDCVIDVDPRRDVATCTPADGREICTSCARVGAIMARCLIESPATRSPSAVATGVYAVSFGVLSVAAGFSVAQTCVMSLVAFTGASQFTFVSVIGAGGERRRRAPAGGAARRAQRHLRAEPRLRPARGALAAGARRASGHRRVDGDGARPARPGRAAARLPADRARDLRVLERRDARRGAGRRRARRPADVRAGRDLPGRLPRPSCPAGPLARRRSRRRSAGAAIAAGAAARHSRRGAGHGVRARRRCRCSSAGRGT